jgi:hypothetical protein
MCHWINSRWTQMLGRAAKAHHRSDHHHRNDALRWLISCGNCWLPSCFIVILWYNVSFWHHRLEFTSIKRCWNNFNQEDYRWNTEDIRPCSWFSKSDLLSLSFSGDFDDDCNDFVDYFEKTWNGESKRKSTLCRDLTDPFITRCMS